MDHDPGKQNHHEDQKEMWLQGAEPERHARAKRAGSVPLEKEHEPEQREEGGLSGDEADEGGTEGVSQKAQDLVGPAMHSP